MKVLCIYHGNCADGFGAAWAVRNGLKSWPGLDVEYFPGVHQQEPPDVTGKTVVMVDFSYKRPVIEAMAGIAQSILILDHHKTAAEDLAGFPAPPRDIVDHLGDGLPCKCWLPLEGVYARFDMTKSGAMLAWEHFNNGNAPGLLHHIQDRDLWQFKLPGTREIQAALFSYPYDFDVWDGLVNNVVYGLPRMITDGQAIERKHHKDIAELVTVVTRMMKIGGQVVPVANLPYTLTSDAGHLLCGEVQCPPGIGGTTTSRYPFAGCYWDTPEGRVFSLRSREDGFDVSEIAKQYGGGGHKHASGFRVPYDQLKQFEI